MNSLIEIRALDSCVGNEFVYAKGGVYFAPEDRAKDLVKAGLAELVNPAKPGIETAAVAKNTIQTRKK